MLVAFAAIPIGTAFAPPVHSNALRILLFQPPTVVHFQPPDYTIEDDGEEEYVSVSHPQLTNGQQISKIQPKSEKDEDDLYVDQASESHRRPKRLKRKKAVTADMVGTSWMQKNSKFSDQTVGLIESIVPEPAPKPHFEESTEKGEKRKRDFRQDFRGTRVFVQGIPPGISWQDLKDHFKIAGDVVFASISVDMQTGQSKGHGLVQYATTDEAEYAIRAMRDHPLRESILFVRKDVQEGFSNPQLRPFPKGPTPPTKWKCANEDNAAYMSEDEHANIKTLINARDDARRRRKYEISDRIRDELKDDYGIFIDDRLKLWWTSIDGKKVPRAIEAIKGDGRWTVKKWHQIPTTLENDACVDADLVEGLLKQRDIARREKDFTTSDALLEEARTAPDGELTLRIHDESRTWRVWTEERPPQQVAHTRLSKDPVEARKEAARECIEIVKEFAPNKINEITTVLKKFPGREFQVLKRLKNQYL